MGKKNLDYVCVPRDEYDELIECRTHINAVYKFITNAREINLNFQGCKQNRASMRTLELVSGYSENEKYFEKLAKEFKERVGGNNDNRITTYGEFQGN